MPQRPSTTRKAPSTSRSAPWKRWVIGGLGVAAVGLLVWAVSRDVTANPQSGFTPPDGVETFVVESYDHIAGPVDYPQDPPVGGPHDSNALACAAYDTPVRSENAVHSLEHGAVWITYQPELDTSAVEDLKRYARQSEILVSPYPGLDSPVVLSTWGTQLRLQSVDDEVIRQFIGSFKNQTAPENAAAC